MASPMPPKPGVGYKTPVRKPLPKPVPRSAPVKKPLPMVKKKIV